MTRLQPLQLSAAGLRLGVRHDGDIWYHQNV